MGQTARSLSLLAALLAGVYSCRATHSTPPTPLRVATDVPVRFHPEVQAARLLPEDTLAGPGCLSPLIDPRDETRITLVRSAVTYGDYAVPRGRYGAGERDLLRVDCNTGEPLGVVRK